MPDKLSAGRPEFKEALKFWFKLGWISFGGTAGHIAIMHDFLVDKKKWISNSRFFHALSICMLLPGPEAQQLAIYIGKQLHGRKGGLAAGTLFVLPSMFILLGLSIIYVSYGNLPWIYAMFNGLKPAVIAIIIGALFKVGQKSLQGVLHYVVAGIAFVCIFFFNIPLLTIIIATILLALLIRYIFPRVLKVDAGQEEQLASNEQEYFVNKFSVTENQFELKQLLMQLLVFLLLWLLPLAFFYLFSPDFLFWKTLILFFTQTAFFTIGGSYTVMPYVAQFAVGKLNWLSKSQMVDGFALAETTPGPLIIVVGFVGFMAGFNHFHASIAMGSIALFATIFYTFLPCFLYVFAGGPLIEKSHGSEIVSQILKLVTAAVVGVILNLTLFLGKDVVFPGGLSWHHLNVLSTVWIGVTLVLMQRFKLNVIYLILLSLALGLLRFVLKV
ncbi:chromate efflux transporter [Mucilaginibacter lappiensis]|uniref:Chromate transporter n=1 Tax=Mucilaginibacter lappiensis TaxID=354630 RepID=A0A1N7DSM7_9SPHI|nr:chromate efflux transporter [Mucilaginibacter lappiensis]MBB6111418.1 chromate transporter [Mucilaginibacter lappiensis]MBB6131872.1 chromate transporter [Mucilaginibacter lappiensis]SIR78820.1 chromate transporter [Mucilaginibacter lappiensis]